MHELYRTLADFWPHLLAGVGLFFSIWASGHVLLRKDEALAALAWMGIIWLVPFLGSLLYWAFGINRVRRRAQQLRSSLTCATGLGVYWSLEDHDFLHIERWHGLKETLDRLTAQPLLPGNRVEMLVDGNAAYPEMLAAIAQARHSIAVATYIFANDCWGRTFALALAQAQARGVTVRVLLDGLGHHYSWPSIVRYLRRHQLVHALFLHSFLPWRMPYLNLRNHRKLLLIDGRLGFTGGLNLSERHVGMPPRARDLHFRLEGPVVMQMVQAFAEDWLYTSGEKLAGAAWYPDLSVQGKALARGISDGPDEDYGKFRWALLAALGQAQESVLVMSPYFLPDESLKTALQHAALRGVEVIILLPGKNNWPLVRWASHVVLPSLMAAGCRVYCSPAPFDHSKILVVDGVWVLLGSGNWDPRSFRMNFEFNVEVYDRRLAATVNAHAREIIVGSQALVHAEFKQRPGWVRIRDGLAHLFTPYL